MSTNTILLLQSIAITLQTINAGLSGVVHDPVLSLMVASIVGGYQFYIQNLGNKTLPMNATTSTTTTETVEHRQNPPATVTTTVEKTKTDPPPEVQK
jgi:hypothetical protein